MKAGEIKEEKLECSGDGMPVLGYLVVFAKDLDAFGADGISKRSCHNGLTNLARPRGQRLAGSRACCSMMSYRSAKFWPRNT